MNSKILFLFFSLLVVISSLKISTSQHLLEPFSTNIILRASKGISQNSFIRLLRFATTDKGIVEAWNNKQPFTTTQESKIRKYILGNEEISSELLNTFQLRTGYSWVANLTGTTKKEIVNASLNYPVGNSLDNQTLNGLIKELRNNKEIEEKFNNSITNSTEENSKPESNSEVNDDDNDIVSEGISEETEVDIMKDSEDINDNYYDYYDWNRKDEESYNEHWLDEKNGYYNEDVDENSEELNSEEGGEYGEDEDNIDGEYNNTNSTEQNSESEQNSEGKRDNDDIVSEEIPEESEFDLMNYSEESNDKFYENYDWNRKDDEEYNRNWLKEEIKEEENKNDWTEEEHELENGESSWDSSSEEGRDRI